MGCMDGESRPTNVQNNLCDGCRTIPANVFYSSAPSTAENRRESVQTSKHTLFQGKEGFHHLQTSAAAGCPLCALFEDALSSSTYAPKDQLLRHPQYCDGGVRLVRDELGRLLVTYGRLSENELEARLVIHGKDASTPDEHLEPTNYLNVNESDAPANFSLVREWLAICCKTHPVECGGPVSLTHHELPKRLLDVASPDKIRLRLTSELQVQDGVGYAALSHCWGNLEPLKTVRSNEEAHLSGFFETVLPQTFADAARTTRELGLQYLWIDSLCIVQDNATDAQLECARMNTIYANATITISASDAKDCSEGLFRSRTMKPVELAYEQNDTEPGLTVMVQPSFSGPWIRGIQGPLQNRAWVLQERHLSTRVVHYTKKCIMWECRKAISAEYAPAMVTKARPNARFFGPSRASNSSVRFLDGGRAKLESNQYLLRHELRQRWYTVVQQYSRRALSNPQDRLPAIAGFAAEWKRYQPEDEYLAGLWKSDLCTALLWFPGRDMDDLRRPLPDATADPAARNWPPASLYPGIPSWSWAAFNGGVTHFGDRWLPADLYANTPTSPRALRLHPDITTPGASVSRERYPLQIHHASTTIVGKNMYGHVLGGQITLSSWCMSVAMSEEINFRPDLGPKPGSVAANHNNNNTTNTSCADEPRPIPSNHNKAILTDGPKRYHLYTDTGVYNGVLLFDYDPVHLPEIQVLLLQVGMGLNFRGSLSAVCGLVLMPATTATTPAEEANNKQKEQSNNEPSTEQNSHEKIHYNRIGTFDLIDETTWMKKRETKILTIV